MRSRAEEIAEINRFLSARGPTRCPDRFAGPVTAALSSREEATRIAGITVKPTPTLAENVARLKRSMVWLVR
jgi:hypothetical protein